MNLGCFLYRYLIYNRLAQKIFWAIYQSLPGRLNAFIEILFCNLGPDTPNKVTSQSQQQLLDQKEPRVVHCQSHLLDHCFHMSNPLTSNYQSILHWFQLHCLWYHFGQFLWEKILHLRICWYFSQSLCYICCTHHNFFKVIDHQAVQLRQKWRFILVKKIFLRPHSFCWQY